jgi:hypothetical protein
MVALDHNLRVQLKERRNRLYKVDFRIWPNEARLMIKWMLERPYLAALLAEVEGADIELVVLC